MLCKRKCYFDYLHKIRVRKHSKHHSNVSQSMNFRSFKILIHFFLLLQQLWNKLILANSVPIKYFFSYRENNLRRSQFFLGVLDWLKRTLQI